MNYVIIGNSAGAVGCIEGIRSKDKTGTITLVSNEPYHTYSRPLISYLLYGKTDEQRMKYRSDSFYKDNNVTTYLGKEVVSIDRKENKIILNDNKEIKYDKLLIATGSSPFIPPMSGLEKVRDKFTFMSLDDAKKLQSVLSKDKNVLIIGAGLIGLKCCEGIKDKVKSITVVDLADRILPSILDNKASTVVQNYIEKQDVEFILNDCVSEFSEKTAVLKSGKKVDFDILVIAVGVRPNIKLAKDAGLDVVKGISTDSHCRTNDENIYAAGDCSESYDIISQTNRVLALLPNAYMQGQTAGINMTGGNVEYNKAIAMNSIGFFGMHIVTAGCYTGEEIVVSDTENYKKFFVSDNKLNGYIIIGDIKRAGIYTSLIRDRVPLDTIDFDLIKDKPQLMAFAKDIRKDKLARRR